MKEEMKILAIDGMGSPGIIWRQLVRPALASHPNLEATYAHWFDLPRLLAEGKHYHIIAGHSLGGDTAVRYCEKLQPSMQPDLLMLLGARYQTDIKQASNWDWLLPYDSAQVFKAPNAVTHNFWTYGPFCSAPCEGATENVRIGLPYWHGSLPAAPQVRECLEAALK